MEKSRLFCRGESGSDSDTSSSSSSSSCTVRSQQERVYNERARRWLILDDDRQQTHLCHHGHNGSASRSSSCSSRSSGGDSHTNSVSDNLEFDEFNIQAQMVSTEIALAARTVHIAVRQRRGSKLWTAIWGFPDRVLGHRMDLPKILRAMKKMFKTNGSLRKEAKLGVVIQLNGDCWKAARRFLVHQNLIEEESIECHGVLGLGLGGLRDLAQLDAMLMEEGKPQALLPMASTSRSVSHHPACLANTFQPQRVCLVGFQGLTHAAVAQELLSLEAQLRTKTHRTRGGDDIAYRTGAALEHLEVVDVDSDSGEVILLVREQTSYNTILGLFAKGSLKIRGRAVAIRRDGDIHNAMEWHQIRLILCNIEKSRGHRCAESRQLVRRLEELLVVVDANTRGLFGAREVLAILSLSIRFEFDHCVTTFGRAKCDSWKRTFTLVQRALETLITAPDLMANHALDLSADVHGSVLLGREDQTFNFLHYSIFQLDDEFQKILHTCDQEALPCYLPDFYNMLRLLERGCFFFQKHRDLCPEAHWRIAARTLDGVYSMDSAFFDLSGIGQEIEMPTLASWIHHLSTIVCTSGDKIAQTRATLQQVYYYALYGQFQEASTLLVLSQAADQARLMDQHIQILCNQAVAQLGLCAFRLGKLFEAQECLQNICENGHAKELLGHRPRLDEKARAQSMLPTFRSSSLPCHRIISAELVEVVYLITEMLWQMPRLVSIDRGSKVTPKSFFQRKLYQLEAATYSGPPQDRYECVLVAGRRLQQGDWECCMALCERALVGVWHGNEVNQVMNMLRENVKKSAVKTYLIDSCSMHENFELSRLANMFCLDERYVHSIVSRMMIEKEFLATWDESSRLILVHEKAAPTPIWDMADHLADVASSIVERNERRMNDVARTSALRSFKKPRSQDEIGQKIALLVRSKENASSKPAKVRDTVVENCKDAAVTRSIGDVGKGRQSRFRKDLINLNKAVAKWLKKVAAKQMRHDELLVCIARSPAVEHLQQLHGTSFCQETFAKELLARAAKTTDN